MTFLRVGMHLINLERVLSINLDAPLVRRPGASTGVQINFGGMDIEVFQSDEADALRELLMGKANGNHFFCGGLDSIQIVDVPMKAESLVGN